MCRKQLQMWFRVNKIEQKNIKFVFCKYCFSEMCDWLPIINSLRVKRGKGSFIHLRAMIAVFSNENIMYSLTIWNNSQLISPDITRDSGKRNDFSQSLWWKRFFDFILKEKTSWNVVKLSKWKIQEHKMDPTPDDKINHKLIFQFKTIRYFKKEEPCLLVPTF